MVAPLPLPLLNAVPPRDSSPDRRHATDAVNAPVELDVSGMSCAGCAARIQAAIERLPGVRRSSVNFATNRATIWPADANDARIVDTAAAAIRSLGYRATSTVTSAARGDAAGAGSREEQAARYERALRWRVILASACTLPVVVIAMSHGAVLSGPVSVWLQLLLTIPVLLLAIDPIFRVAWRSLRHGTAEMNVLVAMGTLAAFGWSVFGLVVRHDAPAESMHTPVYFEAAAVILTLVLLGRWLEWRARLRAGLALEQLLRLQPTQACVIRQGREEWVPLSEVQRGEHFVVRPGGQIPVDATVREGEADVDQSLLTGESVPVPRRPGDVVLAGTLNVDGWLRCEATGIGQQTLLQQIVTLVERAQGEKPPIARLADRVSGWMVPAVLVLALLAATGWLLLGPASQRSALAIEAFISVLIVACPCALGLATPAAILVATGRAARLGLLVRRGAALEALAQVRTLVCDKTGTITQGRPTVHAVRSADGRDVDAGELPEWLAWAASVERASEHPYAKAVTHEADRRGARLQQADQFRATVGAGVQGIVADHQVVVGSEAFLERRGIAVHKPPVTEAATADQAGLSTIWVAVDGVAVGRLLVGDEPRDDAAATVATLRRWGIDAVLLTGDRAAMAQDIAAGVGITQVVAEQQPDQKAQFVAEARRLRPVAMIGDGTNDAPALAAADVGIAMGLGTDVAISTADITLLSGRFSAVLDAIGLSRATMRIIRQNLAWAFVYNLLALPLAAGVLYPWTGMMLSPMVASAAMVCSSLSVLVNSLRLTTWHRDDHAPARSR